MGKRQMKSPAESLSTARRWFPKESRKCLLGAVVVLVLVLIVHWPGLHAGALCFDDAEYLTNNLLVRNPGLESAWRFLGEVLEPSTVHGYYQPLTMISLMVDFSMGGRPERLFEFHFTSLLLHLANTLLIVVLLYALFGDGLVAGLAGLLFGVHPITVETIVWIGERKTVLAAFFGLLSLVAYVHYARSDRRWAYGASVTAFVLGLMSKPTITPLPACLLLLDYWPLKRLSRRAVLEKVPFLIIAAVSAYITFESQRRTAVAVLPGQDESMPTAYIICHNIVFYLWKAVFPIRMSSNYAFPSPLNMSQPAVAAGVVGTIILAALLIVSWRWTPAFVVGWLFFFVAVFPTLGVIGFTNVIAADKYAYWPMVGFLIVLAWGLGRLRSGGDGRKRRAASHLVLSAGVLAALGLAIGTRGYLRHWRTTESLFRYVVSLDDNAAAPLIHLGLELERQGRSAEAVPLLRKSTMLAPRFEGTHYNLGNALLSLGAYDEAIAAYRNAIAVEPGYAEAYNNLGNALLAKGDAAAAAAAYTRAIQLAPRHPDAHYNLANVLVRQNETAAAIAEYQETIRLKPGHAAAHKNLAGVYLRTQQTDQAVKHYEQALRLEPTYWDVAVYLADFLVSSPDPAFRQPDRAVQFARHAVEVTGGKSLPAWMALAKACGVAGRPEEAAAAAHQAVNLATATGNQQALAEIERFLAGSR